MYYGEYFRVLNSRDEGCLNIYARRPTKHSLGYIVQVSNVSKHVIQPRFITNDVVT